MEFADLSVGMVVAVKAPYIDPTQRSSRYLVVSTAHQMTDSPTSYRTVVEFPRPNGTKTSISSKRLMLRPVHESERSVVVTMVEDNGDVSPNLLALKVRDIEGDWAKVEAKRERVRQAEREERHRERIVAGITRTSWRSTAQRLVDLGITPWWSEGEDSGRMTLSVTDLIKMLDLIEEKSP